MKDPEGVWPISRSTLQEGWVKDPEGKTQLWIPIEWRMPHNQVWFTNLTTLLLDLPGATVIIMF